MYTLKNYLLTTPCRTILWQFELKTGFNSFIIIPAMYCKASAHDI